ncbi:hypothetical protein ACN28G_18210 [Micromonospora sp. WMMA1923]|uniref:hypothetical protein n=1 Tax=Micromonospora sp. WMMA1923 TaxID=3404125 RepID=UPI003B947DBE
MAVNPGGTENSWLRSASPTSDGGASGYDSPDEYQWNQGQYQFYRFENDGRVRMSSYNPDYQPHQAMRSLRDGIDECHLPFTSPAIDLSGPRVPSYAATSTMGAASEAAGMRLRGAGSAGRGGEPRRPPRPAGDHSTRDRRQRGSRGTGN